MKRFSLAIVILVIAGWAGYWWNAPEQVLKRRTDGLLRTLTLDAKAATAARQMGVYPLSAMLAAEVAFDMPSIADSNGVFTREEIESTYSWLCERALQSRFERLRYEGVVCHGGEADVKVEVKALVELPSGRAVDGVYHVTIHWQHQQEGWRIARVMCRDQASGQ